MSSIYSSHTVLDGLFEPEGIYLAPPVQAPLRVLCGWGEDPTGAADFRYNGVPLKGHVGLDLAVAAGARLLATDAGRVVEVASERGGFERYIKLEHRWGESFYANVGEILVETGQSVQRGEAIALAFEPAGARSQAAPLFFHFGIRVAPFSRYDGWGGFTDPTPYLPAGSLLPGGEGSGAGDLPTGRPLHPMADERQGMRRP